MSKLLTALVAGAVALPLGQAAAQTVDQATLPDIQVQLGNGITGGRDLNKAAITDGSGSYSSGAVTIAGKVPVRRIDVPQSISVLTRQQMDDQNLLTVTEALPKITGVTMISNDSTQSQFYARGNAMESMVDGAPAQNAFSGYQQLMLTIYDRLEVLRGPAGLLQGSGNPSGVVNFVKKQPKDVAGASFTTSFGSWNNKYGELDITGPIDPEKRLRYRAILAGNDTDYFFKNAHDRKWIGALFVEYDLTKNTKLSVSAVNQDDKAPSNSGLPAWTNGQFFNVSRSTNPYPSWSRYLWNTQEYNANVEHKFDNNWVGKVTLTRRNQEFDFKDSYPTTGVDPNTLTATYARRHAIFTYQRDSADAYLSGPLELFGRKHDLLLGANYAYFSSQGKRVNYTSVNNVPVFNPDTVAEPFGAFNQGPESETKQYGVYGQARIRLLDPLSVLVGGRFTSYEARSRTIPPGATTLWTPGAKINGHFSPYGAVIYELQKDLNLYASYSDIFIPTTQLKANGSVLEPRTGKQYEVGIKKELFGGKAQASLAVFQIKDMNRAYADIANPGFFLNAGEVESKGIEAEITGTLLPGWEAMIGYAHTKSVYVNDKNNPPGTRWDYWQPEHTLKMWNKYTFNEGAWKGLSLGLGVIANSETRGNGTGIIRVQHPYTVVDAQIGYQFTKNVKATFSVNNLFDTVYRTRIGGLNTYNTYGDPRNYKLSMNAKF